jgi:thiol-disulfide isomerase/thioredoxin
MNRKLWYLLPLLPILTISAALIGRSVTTPQSVPPPYDSYTKVGAPMPQFTVTTLDGKRFDVAGLKGKVIIVNLWATWCGPCKEEMPRLEKEVWKNANPSDLAMIAIAREETNEKIAAFRKENSYTFPMAEDPNRRIFNLFASAGIPRTYIVGRDGKILFQSLGYTAPEFDNFKTILEAELKKPKQ